MPKNVAMLALLVAVLALGTSAVSRAEQDEKKAEAKGVKTKPDAEVPYDQLLLIGGIGGLLPDALRLLKYFRTAKAEREANPLADFGTYFGAALQIGLGTLAVWLVDPTTKIQAAALGYSAPELLTRTLTALQGQKQADRSAKPEESSAPGPEGRSVSWPNRLLQWWAL